MPWIFFSYQSIFIPSNLCINFLNSHKFRVEVGGGVAWNNRAFHLRFCPHLPPPPPPKKQEALEGVSLDLYLRHSIFRSVVFCLGSIKQSVQKWYCASFAPKQINIQESEDDEGHTYAHSNGDHFAPSATEN